MAHEITVYEHALSPYAQKIKIALREKHLAFTVQQPMGQDGDQRAFETDNPRREVPLFVDAETTIFDSSIILQYIEDKWPDPALLPASPARRARARMLEEVLDTHFEANTWGLSEVQIFARAEGSVAEQLNKAAAAGIQSWFTWLETELGEQPWFNGTTFGWGDVCAAPFVASAARFDLQPTAGTPLAEWLERVCQRVSVAETLSEAQAAELDPAIMQAAIKAGFKREYRDYRLEWMIKSGGLAVVADGLDADNLRFN